MPYIKLGHPGGDTPVRYIGYSTDTKPPKDPLEDPPDGSTFQEMDTGKIYTWDSKTWVYGSQDDLHAISSQALLELLIFEVYQLRVAVETALA